MSKDNTPFTAVLRESTEYLEKVSTQASSSQQLRAWCLTKMEMAPTAR